MYIKEFKRRIIQLEEIINKIEKVPEYDGVELKEKLPAGCVAGSFCK